MNLGAITVLGGSVVAVGVVAGGMTLVGPMLVFLSVVKCRSSAPRVTRAN